MKKIIMAVSVAIATSVLNAASCSWAVSGVKTVDGSASATGYMAYFFLTDSTVGDYTTVSKAAVLASIEGGTFATDYASTAFASKATNNGSISVTGLAGAFGAGDTASGFTVIFDGATFAEANNYIATAEVNLSWTSPTGSKPFAFTKVSENYTWNAMAVPEPTSGLMLLLGMAGLALRRRRA